MSPEEIVDAVLPCMGNPSLFPGEREAILATLKAGQEFGFGNLIAWLQTAWAMRLEAEGLDRKTAIKASHNRSPYPWPKPQTPEQE